MRPPNDTIAAVATAPGAAGLAVVRVSGPDALSVADAVFRGSTRLAEATTHTLHHGWLVWPEEAAVEVRDRAGTNGGSGASRRVDEVVAAIFRAPRSYTREDVVEFSCHGGSLPGKNVLAALVRAGARLAAPGEFTLRAFLSGRIDLAQAEAVADLIHAETESARELALAQLAGDLSRGLDRLSERLADGLSEIEARIDFAEDVGGIEVPERVIEAIEAAAQDLASLLSGSPFARAVREGVRVPLVGRPNVGKSSLFNALLGEERAIVTAAPGTTRDRVSEALEIAGIRVTLSDTAGLRRAEGEVEEMGIARSRHALEESRFALWVVDGSSPLAAEDRWVAERLADKHVLVALNKRDLPGVVEGNELEGLLGNVRRRTIVPVSASRHEGMEELRSGLVDLMEGTRPEGGLGSAVGNSRHVEALERARVGLERAAAAGRTGEPGEIVALELREALRAIGEVTGRTLDEDLLERIFSRFCIGK